MKNLNSLKSESEDLPTFLGSTGWWAENYEIDMNWDWLSDLIDHFWLQVNSIWDSSWFAFTYQW